MAKIARKITAKTTEKWSREQVQILIDAYEVEEYLYVVKNPNYHNKLRSAALRRVVEKVIAVRPTTNQKECKQKIHSLRNQFTAENAKRKDSMRSGAGATDVYEPSFWYFTLLLFLEDHYNPRKSSSTLPADNTDNNDDTQSEFEGMTEDGRIIVYHTDDSDDDDDDSEAPSQASRVANTASPAPSPAPTSARSEAPSPVPVPGTSGTSRHTSSTPGYSTQSSGSEDILMPAPKKRAKSSQVEEVNNVNKLLNKIDKYMDVPLQLPPCSKVQTQPGNRIVSAMKYVTDSILSLTDKKRQTRAMHDILQIARETEMAKLFEEE